MFKVAIVDDEIWVCRLIQKLIDWEELGLELAFVENDGESGLERIIDERPDIVLSDIRMPNMDGMKMLEGIRQKRIDSRVIIISGYPDFDYAKKVMRYGAYDYLLKPVEKHELKNVLVKIVEELKKETAQKAEIYHQSENVEKIRDVTSELFIRKLVAKRRIEESLLKLAINNKLTLDSVENQYTVIVIKAILDDTNNKDSLTFIENYKELYSDLNQQCNKITFFINNFRVFILNHEDETAEKIDSYLRQEYAELKYNQGRNVVISYSEAFQDINNIEAAFDQAIRGTCQYMVRNNKKHIYPSSAEYDLEHGLFPRELTKMLIINVEALSVESMIEVVHQMYEIIYDKARKKPHIMQEISIKISNIILSTLKGMDESGNDEFRLEKEFFNRISACNKVEEFEPVAEKFFREKIEELYEKRRDKSINIIERAKQYIAQNYERKITLGDVAGYLYLNPKYFSNIFKKEVGIGFVDYVNSVRIDVSKDLLKGNKYSIGQVASKVGFSDPKHFSKLFKKKTQTTPKEYRQYHI